MFLLKLLNKNNNNNVITEWIPKRKDKSIYSIIRIIKILLVHNFFRNQIKKILRNQSLILIIKILEILRKRIIRNILKWIWINKGKT
jgi:hypothetical protein